MQHNLQSANALAANSQRLGRYQLVTSLGQGGMGTINLALMAGMGDFQKLVVVKELRRDLARNAHFVDMFLHEAKLASRLNHPNVVQTLEAGQVDDRYFLSMEFLDGQPFHELLKRSNEPPAISLQLRLQIICDVLAGLHYAHDLQDYDGQPLSIVHCDVSPQNVFVTYDGQVKVVDFGIAKAGGVGRAEELFKGRLAYAAPEQILAEPIDRRADVFSAGVLLWEAITLQRFTPRSMDDQTVVERRLAGAEPRVAQVMPNVDRTLAEVCDCAISHNPSERFATAEEFRMALSQVVTFLGPLLDARTIGQFMCKKFASERLARHRIINAHVRQDETLVKLRMAGVAGLPNETDETKVADLSELVEITRSQELVDLTMYPRPKNRLWLAAGAAGAALLVGLVAIVAELDEPAPSGGTITDLEAARPARTPNSEPLTKPDRAAQGKAVADSDSSATNLDGLEVVDDDGKQPRATAARVTPPQHQVGRPVVRAAPASRPAAADPEDHVDTATVASAKPGFRAGLDLRTTTKRQQRDIDESNPFR